MSKDTIYRQAAIDAVSGGMCSGWDCDVIDKLKALPSVQPDKDLIHLQKEQAYMQGYEDGQKSRKGKWIDYSDEGYVECPFCHSATNCDDNKDELHYCFSCGAELR